MENKLVVQKRTTPADFAFGKSSRNGFVTGEILRSRSEAFQYLRRLNIVEFLV